MDSAEQRAARTEDRGPRTEDRVESPVSGDFRLGETTLVRLRAHMNSRVKVPDLADTVGPVTESNCIGAITPGGEQLNVNNQSVTPDLREEDQSELDSVGGVDEPPSERRSPNKIERPAQREWIAAGRAPQMVGDRMVGSSCDVNQGTTVGGAKRVCRGQSVRSSWETGNDRGAKGRRNVVVNAGSNPSHKDQRSALWADRVGVTESRLGLTDRSQWAAWKQVSGTQVCAAGATLPKRPESSA